eukprot:377831-Rhodomonas_salina.1
MFGTGIAYAATLSAYALAMRCPVLTSAMLLPGISRTFRVTARNANGYSSASSIVTGTPFPMPGQYCQHTCDTKYPVLSVRDKPPYCERNRYQYLRHVVLAPSSLRAPSGISGTDLAYPATREAPSGDVGQSV